MKVEGGILSPGRGKVGPVVMSEWKGQPYIKIKVTPPNPRTPAQFYSRALLTALGNIMKNAVEDISKPYIDPLLKKMSGYNALIQKNYSIIAGENPKLVPTPPDTALISNPFIPVIDSLILSQGQLEPLGGILSAERNIATDEVDFAWNPATAGNGESTDTVVLVVIRAPKIINLNNPDIASTIDDLQPALLFMSSTSTRADGLATLPIFPGLTIGNLRAFAFATRVQGGKPYSSITSNSEITQEV